MIDSVPEGAFSLVRGARQCGDANHTRPHLETMELLVFTHRTIIPGPVTGTVVPR